MITLKEKNESEEVILNKVSEAGTDDYQRYWGPTPRGGGPNNTKSTFLTHRTTHLGKIFGGKAPENGAEGAVLENFRDFSENCFLMQ